MTPCAPECWSMPECGTCGRRKAPRGRSVPLPAADGYCTGGCPGYFAAPQAGRTFLDDCNDYVVANHFRDIARDINSAVAEREAKLRGALSSLATAAEAAIGTMGSPAEDFVDGHVDQVRVALWDRFYNAMDVLSGGGEHVDPREAISYAVLAGQLQAKLEGAWLPLLDEMLEKPGELSTVAMNLLRALGISTERDWRVELAGKLLTDEELRAECARRGMYLQPPTSPVVLGARMAEWLENEAERLATSNSVRVTNIEVGGDARGEVLLMGAPAAPDAPDRFVRAAADRCGQPFVEFGPTPDGPWTRWAQASTSAPEPQPQPPTQPPAQPRSPPRRRTPRR